jgi:PAS domain S-box-containing protein
MTGTDKKKTKAQLIDELTELRRRLAHLEKSHAGQTAIDERLGKADAAFRLITETIQDVFWMSTPGIQKMLYVSPAYEKIWGRSRETLYKSPKSFADAIHPEDRDRIIEGVKAHARGSWDFEYRIIQPDGSVRWIHDRGFPLRDEKGTLYLMTGVASDITERKCMEMLLQDKNEFFETILSNIHFLIAYMDSRFNFIQVNDAYARAAGKKPEFFINKNHFDLYPHKENEAVFRRVVETGEAYHAFEKAFEYPDQSEKGVTYWDWSLQPTMDEKGQVKGLVLSLIDVTDQKKAQEALSVYAQKLERRNKELQEFASVASHDLQEPLRKIQAFGDRLMSNYAEPLAPTGLDYLERMLSASKRMQALIAALLEYSRVTTKGKPFVSISLSEVLQEVVSNLEVLLEKTEGRVSVAELPSIEADPYQMLQLFQNLIGNGLKFHRKGLSPLVAVDAQESDSVCRITIEDNGIGFEEKYLDRIFMPFQRLHGRSRYEGAGMGLAICRKILERHGGSITAKSTPGQGSQFIVTLPIRQSKNEKL